MPTLHDRFRGCLLGLAVADALGGRFEGQSPEAICERFASVDELMAYPKDELWYTDDTQMAIGVAEALVECGGIQENSLCRMFVDNYVPSRGYGRGARAVLEAMEERKDHRRVAAEYFPGGSYGNGAAMRVAPVGLYFRDDFLQLWEHARLSSLPTHVHPLGIEGAQLLALSVALASVLEMWNRQLFFTQLLDACVSSEFKERMQRAADTTRREDLLALGNGIAALDSVVTAIACFALSPDSYSDTIGTAILLGGDCDTIAAMAGAISGAHLGIHAIPSRLLAYLESSLKGRAYLYQLADQLFDAYQMNRR